VIRAGITYIQVEYCLVWALFVVNLGSAVVKSGVDVVVVDVLILEKLTDGEEFVEKLLIDPVDVVTAANAVTEQTTMMRVAESPAMFS